MGDGFCDDENNNEVCEFDGGDCDEPTGKGPSVITFFSKREGRWVQKMVIWVDFQGINGVNREGRGSKN